MVGGKRPEMIIPKPAEKKVKQIKATNTGLRDEGIETDESDSSDYENNTDESTQEINVDDESDKESVDAYITALKHNLEFLIPPNPEPSEKWFEVEYSVK